MGAFLHVDLVTSSFNLLGPEINFLHLKLFVLP